MDLAPLSRLSLRSIAALTLLAQAAVHWQLWRDGYRSIEVVGPMFLVGVVGAVLLSVLVLIRPSFLGVAAALALSVGQVAALALSKTVGLFGFMTAPGLSGIESTAVASEVVAAIALAFLLVASGRPSLPQLVRDVRD